MHPHSDGALFKATGTSRGICCSVVDDLLSLLDHPLHLHIPQSVPLQYVMVIPSLCVLVNR